MTVCRSYFLLIFPRPEFCYTVLRLMAKCETPKRRPLSRSIPGLCAVLEEWRTELRRCENEERILHGNIYSKSPNLG